MAFADAETGSLSVCDLLAKRLSSKFSGVRTHSSLKKLLTGKTLGRFSKIFEEFGIGLGSFWLACVCALLGTENSRKWQAIKDKKNKKIKRTKSSERIQ